MMHSNKYFQSSAFRPVNSSAFLDASNSEISYCPASTKHSNNYFHHLLFDRWTLRPSSMSVVRRWAIARRPWNIQTRIFIFCFSTGEFFGLFSMSAFWRLAIARRPRSIQTSIFIVCLSTNTLFGLQTCLKFRAELMTIIHEALIF